MQARRAEIQIPELHEQLGKLFLRKRKFDEAIVELRHFVGSRPSDPEGHYLLMMAYRNTGNLVPMKEQQELFKKYSTDRRKRTIAQKVLWQHQAMREPGIAANVTEEKEEQ
jgi:predicted Zn-dependent protease